MIYFFSLVQMPRKDFRYFRNPGFTQDFVMHFRYRKRWVETLSLWDKLPLKVSKARDFEKQKVLVFYVFQQEISNQLEWQYVHPIRFGKRMRTGEGDNDIAHFYLKLKSTVLIQI